MACYGYEGVDAVKAALKEGLSASTEEMPVKVKIRIKGNNLFESSFVPRLTLLLHHFMLSQQHVWIEQKELMP